MRFCVALIRQVARHENSAMMRAAACAMRSMRAHRRKSGAMRSGKRDYARE